MITTAVLILDRAATTAKSLGQEVQRRVPRCGVLSLYESKWTNPGLFTDVAEQLVTTRQRSERLGFATPSSLWG
jgi:hypothetical protein